jgi:hypothetical protein
MLLLYLDHDPEVLLIPGMHLWGCDRRGLNDDCVLLSSFGFALLNQGNQ